MKKVNKMYNQIKRINKIKRNKNKMKINKNIKNKKMK